MAGAGAAGLLALLVLVLPIGSCSTFERLTGTEPLGPSPFTQEPTIRVRIAKALSKATASSSSQVLVRGDGDQPRLVTGSFTIASEQGGIVIRTESKQSLAFPQGVDVELVPAPFPGTDAGGKTITIDGTAYPGFAIVRPKSSESPDTFEIVLEIPMESYIPGVVAREMYSGWPRAAYEMQAVAARTYALHERERARRGNRGHDVENTTLDQVFGGVTSSPAVHDAVRRTEGVTLYAGREILRAYFSSTCGGRPASAGGVWPTTEDLRFNAQAPLQGKSRPFACTQSNRFRWEVERTDQEVSARLRAWGERAGHPIRSLTLLRSVEPKTLNKAGRPDTYTIRSDRGREFVMRAEEFRVGCNVAAPGVPPLARGSQVWSNDVEVEVIGTRVTIRGRGFGHGVGMCQWCAKGFADEGMGWQEMAALFYPGSTTRKLY